MLCSDILNNFTEFHCEGVFGCHRESDFITLFEFTFHCLEQPIDLFMAEAMDNYDFLFIHTT